MSHREPAPDRSCGRPPAIPTSVLLAAFVASSGLAIYSAWPRQEAVAAVGIGGPPTIDSSAAVALREPIDWYQPLIANELIDSLDRSVSRAAGRRIRVALFQEVSSCDPPEDLARILDSASCWIWGFVSPSDIRASILERFDVVVFPGGRASRQAAVLGVAGQQAVRDYVRAGGGYVGICGGAFLATAHPEYLALVNAWTLRDVRNLPGVGLVSLATRGPATVRMELTKAGRKVLGDFPPLIDVNFAGGPIFRNPAGGTAPAFVPLGHYRSEVSQYEAQRGTMIDSPSIIAAQFGKGRIIAISPHPEVTAGLEGLVKRAIAATARDAGAGEPAATSAVSDHTSSTRDP
jgi:glutamine amidotransferase-like uncharacterized protein